MHHRIERTITIDGLELIVYQCCDSRECLFKHVKGGVTFCEYGEVPMDKEADDNIDDHLTGENNSHHGTK